MYPVYSIAAAGSRLFSEGGNLTPEGYVKKHSETSGIVNNHGSV